MRHYPLERIPTSQGADCRYFSNNDGTGLKIYGPELDAKLAWAYQLYFHRKNLAPFVLSNVKSFMLGEEYVWGFLTEEVVTIGNSESCSRVAFYRNVDIIIELLNEINSEACTPWWDFDMHASNIGLTKEGSFVIIDFGSNFQCFNERITAKIEKIAFQKG